MNYNWSCRDTNFQTHQHGYYFPPQGLDNKQYTTKAYLNPHVANFECIKRSLAPSITSNKIHVNPNFKLNQINQQPQPGGSNVSSHLKNSNLSKESVSSSVVSGVTKSQFKKINKVNLKPKYTWCKSDSVNKLSKSLILKPTNYKNLQNAYNFTPKKSKTPEKSISRVYLSKTKIINKSKTKLVNNNSKLNRISTKIYSPLKSPFYNRKSVVMKAAKQVTNKYKYYNSSKFKNCKYKIDKRKQNLKQSAISDISKLFPNNFHTRVKPQSYNMSLHRETHPKTNAVIAKRFPNKRVVKIGGILYKTTTNKLTLAKKKEQKKQTKTKNHIVYVRGEKFLLDNNGKTLKRQPQSVTSDKTPQTPKRIDIGGVTYIQKSTNVLVRTNIHQAQYLVNKAKNKSIAILTNLRKRSTMPCMIYHRFGKCNRHTKGLCMYRHDPKNIAICKMFLKGDCKNSNCLLSHQVIPEKMATCRFFLNGFCDRDNCPFPHVKLNKNVAICEKFLQGFCNLGKECSKRHLHQCPNFDKFGACSLGSKCHYPHKKQSESTNRTDENDDQVQYFIHSRVRQTKGKIKKSQIKKGAKKKLKMDSLSLDNPDASDTIECVPKRIKLDVLPCYIPLQKDT